MICGALGFTGWTTSSISHNQFFVNDLTGIMIGDEAEQRSFSIFHWAATGDGVMGGRWRWAEREVFKGWRCFALNCTAAGCNRRQLEGAEWSSSRWAQPAAPVWQLHRRSNWGPHWLLFLCQIVFVCVLASLFARIWWRWQRKVSGGRIYVNTGLFCVWSQKLRVDVNLCNTWEGREHHRSSRWVSSLSLSLSICVSEGIVDRHGTEL